MQNFAGAEAALKTGVAGEKSGSHPKAVVKHKVIKAIFPYLCILPACACFATFQYFPFLRTLFLSFFLTDNEGNAKAFRGFKNYALIFTSHDYQQVLLNTFLFAGIVIVLSLIISFTTANLANIKGRAFRAFPILFTLPIAAAAGSFSLLFEKMFDPTMGIVNKFLHQDIRWFTDPNLALLTVAAITIWMMSGSNFLYLFAGLKNVPQELLESAEIDGANGLVKLFHIVIPCLSPMLFFVLITDIIAAFQSFTQVQIITQGGPGNATSVIVYSIYRDAFFNFRFGPAAAQSVFLFAIVLIITLIQFKNEKRMVHYE